MKSNTSPISQSEASTSEWEKRFELVIAQSAPFSLLGRYKDADFERLKDFIRSLIHQTRAETAREILELPRLSMTTDRDDLGHPTKTDVFIRRRDIQKFLRKIKLEK